MSRVLVVDDVESDCHALRVALGSRHEVKSSNCHQKAQTVCNRFNPAIILLSMANGHSKAGFDFLGGYEGEASVVIMTDEEMHSEMRVRLVSLDVYWELRKPLDLPEVLSLVAWVMDSGGRSQMEIVLEDLEAPEHNTVLLESHLLLRAAVEKHQARSH